MRVLFLTLLLWQAAESTQIPSAEPRYFYYERLVSVPSPSTDSETQACITLDASIYAHAAQSLKDLRLYEGLREVPYAITVSEPVEQESEPAKMLNLGMRGAKIVFDLEMPNRPYTDLVLNLDAQNFIASAEVSGIRHADETPVGLGTFTLFDLSAQRLSRSTTIDLQESSFSALHIELSLSSAAGTPPFAVTPAIVLGAMVPPSRDAQTLYTPIAETTAIRQQGRKSVASFRLPAHVPVERISFMVAPESGNFSREVSVTDRSLDAPNDAEETLHGNILSVRLNKAGHEIRQEQRSISATLGANLQHDATVEVLVDNGDDSPLPLTAVRLEMRQRKLCFNTPMASRKLTLSYGDTVLEAPVYDYAKLFSLTSKISTASLGPEERNPGYKPRPKPLRPLTERHPELLWIVLLAVVCVLAVLALHSAKREPK